MKGLNYFQAAEQWLAGKAMRRQDWHRWVTWEHWLGWITQPFIPSESLDAYKRVALDTDFTEAEYLATDWTDEPWDAVAFPPPIVESSVTAPAPSDPLSLPPSLLWRFPPGSPELLLLIGGGGGGGGGSPSGNPGSVRPHNPPTGTTATIAITYGTDLMPEGAGCLLGDQFGGGQTCTVFMQVSIVGGPAGVFGLHVEMNSTVFLTNGYNGFTNTFTFTGVPVNPGGAYAPNVIYHPTGGDITATTPAFAIPPACKVVTFDGNGSTGGAMSPQGSATPTALASNFFVRESWIFAGWNTAADGGGTAYANGATYDFSANITLFAQWTAVDHTVTFDANGGTGTMDPQTDNAPVALDSNAFTRTGYTFTGWNTATDGSGTSYADGATYDFAADLTLFAQWTTAPHTVTFDGNGATSGSMADQTSAAPANLTANAYGKTGYTFGGWNTASDGSGTGYTDAQSYDFSADLLLYAQWTPPSHTVTFDGNGSDGGAMSPQTSASAAPLTTNVFTKSGFTFTGWNTAGDGSGTGYSDGQSYDFSADLTLYAQWS